MRRLSRDEANERLVGWRGSSPCVMCDLAQHESDLFVARADHAVVVLDRFAASRGHLLVVLREHTESVAALAWEVYEEVQRLVWRATRVVERELKPRRTFVASFGAPVAVATSFPHVHFHVVPIFGEGDECKPARVFSWSDGVLIYDEGEGEALARELRAVW